MRQLLIALLLLNCVPLCTQAEQRNSGEVENVDPAEFAPPKRSEQYGRRVELRDNFGFSVEVAPREDASDPEAKFGIIIGPDGVRLGYGLSGDENTLESLGREIARPFKGRYGDFAFGVDERALKKAIDEYDSARKDYLRTEAVTLRAEDELIRTYMLAVEETFGNFDQWDLTTWPDVLKELRKHRKRIERDAAIVRAGTKAPLNFILARAESVHTAQVERLKRMGTHFPYKTYQVLNDNPTSGLSKNYVGQGIPNIVYRVFQNEQTLYELYTQLPQWRTAMAEWRDSRDKMWREHRKRLDAFFAKLGTERAAVEAAFNELSELPPGALFRGYAPINGGRVIQFPSNASAVDQNHPVYPLLLVDPFSGAVKPVKSAEDLQFLRAQFERGLLGEGLFFTPVHQLPPGTTCPLGYDEGILRGDSAKNSVTFDFILLEATKGTPTNTIISTVRCVQMLPWAYEVNRRIGKLQLEKELFPDSTPESVSAELAELLEEFSRDYGKHREQLATLIIQRDDLESRFNQLLTFTQDENWVIPNPLDPRKNQGNGRETGPPSVQPPMREQGPPQRRRVPRDGGDPTIGPEGDGSGGNNSDSPRSDSLQQIEDRLERGVRP